jgi:hypothetical protein
MAFYNQFSDSNNFIISFSKNPSMDFCVFAKGYAKAANLLTEHLLEKISFSDYEAYPVVFLYRQALELYLKGFLYQANFISFLKELDDLEIDQKKINKHNLISLVNEFERFCKKLFQCDRELQTFIKKLKQLSLEFQQIDPGSFSYRYPITKDGKASTEKNQLINLISFSNNMQELLVDLESLELMLFEEIDLAKESYKKRI